MTNEKQNVSTIAEQCFRHGVQQAVISPGSRSAPISLAFLRHQKIKCKTIVDERSAGFFALGMAQQLGKPVVLICTSGSALLNYAPAVAEAFYQKIPLIIFSADRPAEWIGQNDGQTIQQKNVFNGNSLGFFEIPVEDLHKDVSWHIERIVSDAINLSQSPPPGPVHVNVPLREPLYPKADLKYPEVKTIQVAKTEATFSEETWTELLNTWEGSKKKLLVAGLNKIDANLASSLNELQQKCGSPILADSTANLNSISTIKYSDMTLWSGSDEMKQKLAPELLISFGGPVVSKSLKLFLRRYKPKAHWHLQAETISIDSFKALTKILPVTANYFFRELNKKLDMRKGKESQEYLESWIEKDMQTSDVLSTFFLETGFSELKAMQLILSELPQRCNLQLGNSSIVRHANFVSIAGAGISVNSNRGTNGIDGTVSTAVGAASVLQVPTVLITGDLAFFYDRNGLWHNELPANLKIIVFNNRGGGIFRNLDGPAQLPELEANFEVEHNLTAESTAVDHGLEYFAARSEHEIKDSLVRFFENDEKPALLEIHFDKYKNAEYFLKFKEMMREIR